MERITMRKVDFKPGIKFYVNQDYRYAYRLRSTINGDLFIKKGGWYQCEVIDIMEDGIYVLSKVLGQPTDTFIPFSAMELIPEENRY